VINHFSSKSTSCPQIQPEVYTGCVIRPATSPSAIA